MAAGVGNDRRAHVPIRARTQGERAREIGRHRAAANFGDFNVADLRPSVAGQATEIQQRIVGDSQASIGNGDGRLMDIDDVGIGGTKEGRDMCWTIDLTLNGHGEKIRVGIRLRRGGCLVGLETCGHANLIGAIGQLDLPVTVRLPNVARPPVKLHHRLLQLGKALLTIDRRRLRRNGAAAWGTHPAVGLAVAASIAFALIRNVAGGSG